MATERNPFDIMTPLEDDNIIQIAQPSESSVNIEIDPSDGGVIVDFSQESVEMEPSEELGEWYGDICDTLEDDFLTEVANDVIENYNADKDSRGEWESMFERGFDLLGLKLEEG